MSVSRIAIAALAGLVLAGAASTSRAEMGPCKPDGHDSLICGSGKGAARVVEDTISPDKRYALAWRTADGDPTEEPKSDDIELVLVRISDGAVLATRPTDFWDTGTGAHVNRLTEEAAWSRNSRFAVRGFHSRWDTEHLDLFVLGPNGEFVGTVDLHKLVEPTLQARVKGRARNVDAWSFWVEIDKTSVSADGGVRMYVMMWVPKDGPERHFDVSLQLTNTKAGPQARIAAIKPVRAPR